MAKLQQGVNDLYTWCMENGERGQQLLYEFGDGNNSQQFTNEFGIILTPHYYSKGSHKKIKWTCETCNSSWYAVIRERTGDSKHSTGCPYCANKNNGINRRKTAAQKIVYMIGVYKMVSMDKE